MTRLLAALLFGIATSITVAVASAIWSPMLRTVDLRGAPWPDKVPADYPTTCACQVQTALGYTREIAFMDSPSQAYFHYGFRAGWPFRAFHAQWVGTAAPLAIAPSGAIRARNGWTPQVGSFPWPADNLRTVPFGMHGLPATANVAAFAAFWLAITGVQRAARRWWRTRRRCCIACGHRLSGSLICSECGSLATTGGPGTAA